MPPRDPAVGLPRSLAAERIPGSVEEARTIINYNERIVATSASRQRRMRAARMLVNVRPHLERLEREEVVRVARIESATPPASTIEGQLQRMRDRKAQPESEFETVWDGTRGRAGASLSSWR